MKAAGRRAGFALFAAALAAVLFCFSTAYLLRVFLAVLILAALGGLLLRRDAGLHLELKTAETAYRVSEGGEVEILLRAIPRGHLLAAGALTADVEIRNVMFGAVRQETLSMPLQRQGSLLRTSLRMEQCGETVIRCVRARIWDPLEVFAVSCRPFEEISVVCLPGRRNVELVLSKDTAGAVREEGMMQNRRGADPAETYDIRQYVPGDDVRAIHWKLSCKTDTLIFREASEPLHYDVLLLPDLAGKRQETEISDEERNSAAAVTAALAEQLVQQGVSFCFAVPGRQGLQIQEVHSRRELQRVMAQWLRQPIPPQSGTGLHLFLTGHMEVYFTRLLLVSAGTHAWDITHIGKDIGIIAVGTSDSTKTPVYMRRTDGNEIVVLPSVQSEEESCRIIC